MSEPLDLSIFVRRDAGLSHLDLAVEGVGCAGCIRKIESGLKRIPGVVDARVNFTNRRLAVDWRNGTLDFFHWLSALIALPAVGYAGQPFFRSALRAIRARQLNMDVPISLGVLLALGVSVVETASHAPHAYFDSAVMLLFFLLCGRYLDHAMRRKTRAVAGNLAALKAETAHRFDDGGELVRVPAGALKPGDRVLVKPGECVPADGVV